MSNEGILPSAIMLFVGAALDHGQTISYGRLDMAVHNNTEWSSATGML